MLVRHERRILASFDRNYGDLLFHWGVALPRGIVFLHFRSQIWNL